MIIFNVEVKKVKRFENQILVVLITLKKEKIEHTIKIHKNRWKSARVDLQSHDKNDERYLNKV